MQALAVAPWRPGPRGGRRAQPNRRRALPPKLFEEAREPAVLHQLALGLARRAVAHDVVLVEDGLELVAAPRTRLAVVAMDRQRHRQLVGDRQRHLLLVVLDRAVEALRNRGAQALGL